MSAPRSTPSGYAIEPVGTPSAFHGSQFEVAAEVEAPLSDMRKAVRLEERSDDLGPCFVSHFVVHGVAAYFYRSEQHPRDLWMLFVDMLACVRQRAAPSKLALEIIEGLQIKGKSWPNKAVDKVYRDQAGLGLATFVKALFPPMKLGVGFEPNTYGRSSDALSRKDARAKRNAARRLAERKRAREALRMKSASGGTGAHGLVLKDFKVSAVPTTADLANATALFNLLNPAIEAAVDAAKRPKRAARSRKLAAGAVVAAAKQKF